MDTDRAVNLAARAEQVTERQVGLNGAGILFQHIKEQIDGFILLLLLTSFTGLALLAGRDTSWMGILLAVHLGVVMALFLTLPYGKFAHGFYRCAALLKWAIEKRRGKQAAVAGD